MLMHKFKLPARVAKTFRRWQIEIPLYTKEWQSGKTVDDRPFFIHLPLHPHPPYP